MESRRPIALPAADSAAAHFPSFLPVIENFFASQRVRHGIRVGSAAVLALWAAQWLRLEHPNWSVTAVLVLANAHYVGAIASKALMRAIGTIAGALLAVWIVGDYADAPPIFLALVFVVVAISSFKAGQLARAASPYAYYLMGLSLVSVATYGIADPSNAWRPGLARTLETLLGVVCGTFVYALLWPRYAREDFDALVGDVLGTISKLARVEFGAPRQREEDPILVLRDEFRARIMRLRMLLSTGNRGSRQFRARLGNYQRTVVALTHIFQALREVREPRAEDGVLELVRPELDRCLATIEADLEALRGATRERDEEGQLKAALADLEAKVRNLREEGIFRRLPTRASECLFGRLGALRLLRDEMDLLRKISGSSPGLRLPAQPADRARAGLATTDKFWMREACKAGISVCAAFVLLKWVHPPGAAAIPLGAWSFSTFGRNSLNTGGKGDLRIFHRIALTALGGIPVVAVLWLVLPFLADEWAMNAVLFGACFVFGSAVAQTVRFSYPVQIGLLGISSLIGLNPQQPVTFATLVNSYLGLMIGVVIGGVVSRTLWPVLPQEIFRLNLADMFDDLLTLRRDPGQREFVLMDTVLLPVEALLTVEEMVLPRCPEGEREALRNFIRMSQPLGMQFTALRRAAVRSLPAPAEARLRGGFDALERAIDQSLGQFSLSLRSRGRMAPEFPDLHGPMDALETLLNQLRDDGALVHEDTERLAHLLELVDRYRTITAHLVRCQAHYARLKLASYLSDVAL